MQEVHWCPACDKRQHWDCTCTPEQLERHGKEQQLERARAEVVRLEAELGVKPTVGANRLQRRAVGSRAKGRRP